MASYNGHKETAVALVDRGADIHVKAKYVSIINTFVLIRLNA